MHPRPTLAVALLATLSCGPKEARDPAEILAEDPAFLPPEDPESSGTGAPPPPAAERPATRGECEAAMRHLEELGLDVAAEQAATPEERAELRARKSELMASPAVRERIDRAANDCVGRETPASEARCVARVRSEGELDACSR